MKRTLVAAVMMAAAITGTMAWGIERPPARGGRGGAAAVQAARDELKAKHDVMLAPETAVTAVMLQELVELHMKANPDAAPRGGVISSVYVPFQTPEYQAVFKQYGGELARALQGKQEKARESCVVTLLTMPGKLAPADQEKVRVWAAGVLAGMDKGQVLNVLKNRWLKARSPELLPVLLKMYDELPDEQVSAGRYGSSELRNILLQRAYELSPEQVRPRVLAAIRNPAKGFSELYVTSLLSLPDKELPEMDEAFATMMTAPPRGPDSVQIWVWSKLISRYGTVKVEAEVKRRFEQAPGRMACAPQESVLAYFLRVDPVYGKQAFARCLASRQTGCWKSMFTGVSALIWTPELEQLAIEGLENRDVDIPVSAARALQLHGPPAVKEALLAALGKEYQANKSADYKEPEASRRRSIVSALLEGHAWVLTAAELAKVQAMAMDAELVKLCQTYAERAAVTVTVSMEESGKAMLRLELESYSTLAELQNKVSLFPAGMKFKVGEEETDVLRQEFMAWAKQKKLAVE